MLWDAPDPATVTARIVTFLVWICMDPLVTIISYCYLEGEYPNVSMLPYTLDFMDSSKNLTRLTKFFRIQRKQEYIP